MFLHSAQSRTLFFVQKRERNYFSSFFEKACFFVQVLSCSVWYTVVKEKENNKTDTKSKPKGGKSQWEQQYFGLISLTNFACFIQAALRSVLPTAPWRSNRDERKCLPSPQKSSGLTIPVSLSSALRLQEELMSALCYDILFGADDRFMI